MDKKEELVGSVQIIDLSVPIKPTPPESPLKVDIEYIDHKKGAKVFGPIFGLKDGDFPEDKFSALEKLTLTTHNRKSYQSRQDTQILWLQSAVFPVKIEKAGGGWARAVAISDE